MSLPNSCFGEICYGLLHLIDIPITLCNDKIEVEGSMHYSPKICLLKTIPLVSRSILFYFLGGFILYLNRLVVTYFIQSVISNFLVEV